MPARESNNDEIFICYAGEDEKRVKGILVALKRIGDFNLFFAPVSIRIGLYNPKIEDALKRCRTCIVFFSKTSMAAPYMNREYNAWLKIHSEDPHHIFIPVELDKDNIPNLISANYQCFEFSDISDEEPWKFCDRIYDLAELVIAAAPMME